MTTWYDDGEKFISGKDYQDADTVKAVFQSEKCITLDELPADLYKNGGTDIVEPKTDDDKDILWGDADCDGFVKMNDAVLVMQSISNGDRFGEDGTDKNRITAKGKRNANVYENATSSITPQDALKIQEFLLQKVATLDPNA